MGFNKDVLRRRRDIMNDWGIRVRWSGRSPKLWKSVISELKEAEDLTKNNTLCTLNMCVNYGGQAEIADATARIAREVAAGKLNPDKITEKTVAKYLEHSDLPPVDLFVRTSGGATVF